MNDEEIIKVAVEEIEKRTWGVTEQFLGVHSIEQTNGQYEIVHVAKDDKDKIAVVYFKIEKEKFFLAICVDYNNNPFLCSVYTENYVNIRLYATSETLSVAELQNLTALSPDIVRHKGEKKSFGNAHYRENEIIFEPNTNPGNFEEKLEQILSFLENDIPGVHKMVVTADCCLQVIMIFHNGNTMIGGIVIPSHLLKRLANLNLHVDFDLYAEGNFFKDENE